MNIVTQFPTNLNLNIANPQTEAARKDALSRNAITQATNAEQHAAGAGVGSDRERSARQSQQPITYEFSKQDIAKALQAAKEQINPDNPQQDHSDAQNNDSDTHDSNAHTNTDERKADSTENKKEQAQIEALQKRDQEVRTHEQAHANIGGQYAGSPSYEYENGPDGKRYAVGGEVKIDVSTIVGDPEATVRKMQQVQRAALAPAEPSGADRRVAMEASSKAQAARADLQAEKQAQALSAGAVTAPAPNSSKIDSNIQLKNISYQNTIDSGANTVATEEMNRAERQQPRYEAPASLKSDTEHPIPDEFTQSIPARDETINARALKIQRHYNVNSYVSGFTDSAINSVTGGSASNAPERAQFTRYA